MRNFFIALMMVFMPITVYANENSVEEQREIDEVVDFAKKTIARALKSAQTEDKDTAYKEVSKMVEDSFDYKNLVKFAMLREYKKLDEEQKSFLETYSRRSIIMMFLEKFVFRSLSYQITRVSKAKMGREDAFEVFIVIKSVEGIQIEEITKEFKDKVPETIDVSLSIKKKGGKYLLQDIKALDMSFLIKEREFFQKALKDNGGDIDVMIDDLIARLERKELDYRQKNGISEKLFPQMKVLITL